MEFEARYPLLVNEEPNLKCNAGGGLLDEPGATSARESIAVGIGSTPEVLEAIVADFHEEAVGFIQKRLTPGGVSAAVYTLCSMSLGVGVFVLPVVLKSVGLLSGLLLIIFMGFWSYRCQIWLIEATKAVGKPCPSYEALAENVFGSFGKLVLALFTALAQLIANAAHMKTAAYMIHDMMEWYVTGDYGIFPYETDKRIFLYVCMFCLVVPFCTGQRINALRYVSTASVTAVLVLCAYCSMECLFWYWPQGRHQFTGPDSAKLLSGNWHDYASAIPAISFAFTSAFCLFPVYKELDRPENINRSVRISTLTCGTGYAVVAVIGILTFGKAVGNDPFTRGDASNYLYVFPPTHLAVSVLSFLMIVCIVLLYPVLNYPMLNALEKIFEMAPFHLFDRFLRWPFHRLLLTVCGMGCVVFLNFQFHSLVTIFGLAGGWGVGFVAYILPSAIYFKMNTSLLARGLALMSIVTMTTIVVGFTYVTFVL